MIALVVGGAECVWADLCKAREMFVSDAVCCVNHIGIDWEGQLDYWASFHPFLMEDWVKRRKAREHPDAQCVIIGTEPQKPVNIPRMFKHPHRGGGSGLLATVALLDFGFDKIVLAGVPMSPDMRHYHDRDKGKPWKAAISHRGKWNDFLPKLQGKVKSFSGWTQKKLGEPSVEWLS